MSQHSGESWRNIPNCIGTVYDPNPLANGWILRHGPDIPALNELKNKLIVTTPPTEPERPARVLPDNIDLTRRPDISRNIAKPTPKRRVLPQLKKHTVASRQYSSSLIRPIIETNRLYTNLNQEQKYIHKAVLSEKNNVLILGSAGSGKSALLKSIISSLKTENNQDHIAITSAMNGQGNTLNRQVILCGDSDLLPPGTRRKTLESEICQDVIKDGFILGSMF
ncbi:hypothetical protein MFLAVUS_004546 [Mucor flavus]|uniref:FtsK domain-containing protein n=1 Tax=Mucor flavus TaxID=439312 RepID=A0ABP9YW87_9FUNG